MSNRTATDAGSTSKARPPSRIGAPPGPGRARLLLAGWTVVVMVVMEGAVVGCAPRHVPQGTVTGSLRAVGGPATLRGAPAPRPLPGRVSIRDGSGAVVTVSAGPDGLFSASVPPGTYTVTGRSRLYNDATAACTVVRPVTVTSRQTTRVDVACEER